VLPGSAARRHRSRRGWCRRLAWWATLWRMRVLVVEDEPFMAEGIRDGLRLEAIAADIAADGHTAMEPRSPASPERTLRDARAV